MQLAIVSSNDPVSPLFTFEGSLTASKGTYAFVEAWWKNLAKFAQASKTRLHDSADSLHQTAFEKVQYDDH